MQTHTPRRSQRRRGTTLVEVAVVLTLFLLFLFGIFEYCRFMLVLQVSTNAARDAARYAVVSSSDSLSWTSTVHPGPRFTFEPAFDSTRPMFQVPILETYVSDRMAYVKPMITGFQVRVYPADSNALYSDPVVIRPKVQTVGLGQWNKAAFTERIAIQIAGFYVPILPTLVNPNGFLMRDAPITVNTVCLMGSEG